MAVGSATSTDAVPTVAGGSPSVGVRSVGGLNSDATITFELTGFGPAALPSVPIASSTAGVKRQAVTASISDWVNGGVERSGLIAWTEPSGRTVTSTMASPPPTASAGSVGSGPPA